MIFMYAVSFGMLGAQYMMGDVFNITLTNFEGTEIRSNVLNIIDVDQINESTLNVVNTNQTTVLTDPIVGAASIAWEIFLLLTGTYVFNILYFFIMPPRSICNNDHP